MNIIKHPDWILFWGSPWQQLSPCYNMYSIVLEYTCNKYMYCDLIGHSGVSTSHRDLQVFIETYEYSQGQRKMHSAAVA